MVEVKEAKPAKISDVLSYIDKQLNKLPKKEKNIYAFKLKSMYKRCRKPLKARVLNFIYDIDEWLNYIYREGKQILIKIYKYYKKGYMECLEMQRPWHL